MRVERHELSALFGNMPEDEFDELVADIAANGVLEPITLFEGKILDGWHRYQAAQRAGKEVETIGFAGDPVAYVVAKNARRRHLSASRRASALVGAVEWRSSGSRTDKGGTGATLDEMASDAGVSRRTITDAKTAEEAGLGDAVRNGEMSAKAAAQQARQENDEPQAPKKLTPLEKALAEIEALRGTITELRETNRDLVDSLESYYNAEQSPDEQALEFKKLREQLRASESQRNYHMQQVEVWKRECRGLRKRLGIKVTE